MTERIGKVEVHLVAVPVAAGYGDATRKVESVGFVIVRVTTQDGLEGVGVTYNEVGGLATKTLIDHDMAPKLLGRDPLETEVIWQEFAQYLRGVARKGLVYCALSAIDIAAVGPEGEAPRVAPLPAARRGHYQSPGLRQRRVDFVFGRSTGPRDDRRREPGL